MSRSVRAFLAPLLACLAFAAIPAAASASNVLYEGETKVAVGTEITTHSNGPVYLYAGAEELFSSCDDARFTGKVSRNDGSNIEVGITEAKFPGHLAEEKCESSLLNNFTLKMKAPLCWRNPITFGEKWKMGNGTCPGSGTTELILTRNLVLGGTETCTYQAENNTFVMENGKLDPLQLHTAGTNSIQWFERKTGAFPCTPRLGMKINTLEVENTSGTKLKLVH